MSLHAGASYRTQDSVSESWTANCSSYKTYKFVGTLFTNQVHKQQVFYKAKHEDNRTTSENLILKVHVPLPTSSELFYFYS